MRTSTKRRRTSPDPRSSPATARAYLERVNLAVDHIVNHLNEPLSLKAISQVAMLSPFHFHRVFQMLMGETPADFSKRLRLERALLMMAHGRGREEKSFTRIGRECGFASSSDFSRCFKQRYGAAPSRFNVAEWSRTHRAELEALVEGQTKAPRLKRLPAAANPDGFNVRIRDLPARTVAYIRVSNPYKSDAVVNACARLVGWAEEHGLADGQWLGYQWENPELVPLEQCRYHAAVEVPHGRFETRGEIGRFRFPSMTVAQVEVRGPIDLELRALQWFYGVWLPRSGYVPDDYPAFEAWIGRPFAHGHQHFELYAQVPVKRP